MKNDVYQVGSVVAGVAGVAGGGWEVPGTVSHVEWLPW